MGNENGRVRELEGEVERLQRRVNQLTNMMPYSAPPGWRPPPPTPPPPRRRRQQQEQLQAFRLWKRMPSVPRH
jgi:hypothetical protein